MKVNQSDPTMLIANLAARILGNEIQQKQKWDAALAEAGRFYTLAAKEADTVLLTMEAQQESSDEKRSGPHYRKIDDLIKSGEIGGVQNRDSLLRNRIRPRIPTRKEVAKAKEHFNPETCSLKMALAAAAEATKAEDRHPALVLNLFGRSLDYESIKGSMTLQWDADDPFWLVERPIIEPTVAPSLSDLKHQIGAFLGEFVYRLGQGG
jgi:hypothetical protein